MKEEYGVMVMKDGKAWGMCYEDGHSTSYGWISPEESHAKVNNPEFCKKPTDVTYKGSPYTKELETAKLVKVVRRTTVEILE